MCVNEAYFPSYCYHCNLCIVAPNCCREGGDEDLDEDESEYEAGAEEGLTYVYSDYDESQQEHENVDDLYDSDSF